MKCKCIKELIINGVTIMSVDDIVHTDGINLYNLTTKVNHPGINYDTIEGCVVNLPNYVTCSSVKALSPFETITANMYETYKKKNHDYGNSFDQSLDKFGLIASVVRLGDKMNRIESLVNKEAQVKDESIRDTIMDMANYCIMTAMWMDKQH